jgi:mannan endo-1,4-beta-mannosidase
MLSSRLGTKEAKEAKQTKYKITRVWGFGDVNYVPSPNATDPNRVWFQLLNSTGAYINYGEDGIQRLDYVVSAAEKAGIKLVLPFVNNWNDYGGINAYVTAFGGDSISWFTDVRSQAVYRDYIKVLVSRYKSSPAIFAWELGNEPRCSGDNYTTILKWATDAAAYIKSLDPNHMVTTGEEGFFDASDGVNNGMSIYSGVAGTSFSHNIKIPDIDYGVFHLYPSWWGYPYSWGDTWIEEHDAIGQAVRWPALTHLGPRWPC